MTEQPSTMGTDVRNISVLILIFVILYAILAYFEQRVGILTRLSQMIVPYFVKL